jgi:hypothetical protein
VPEQERPGLGQGDAATAARSFNELFADDAFERLDLLAHCRLRVPQSLGRAPEGTGGCHCLERREVADLDAEPYIRFSDRFHQYLDWN